MKLVIRVATIESVLSHYNLCDVLQPFSEMWRVSLVVEYLSAIAKDPSSIPAWSHATVMDYGEACFMRLTPGVVHNFPKHVGE